MTDKAKVSDEQSADAELPVPKFSEEASASPTSKQTSDGLEERLAARLSAQLEKLVQSTKDKRLADFDRLTREVGGVDALVARLKAHGAEVPDEVLSKVRQESEIEELRRKVDSMATSQPLSGKVEEQTDIWRKVVDETGLDATQVALLAQRAAKGEFRNQDHMLLEAHRLSKTKPNPVTPAEDVSQPTRRSGGLSDERASELLEKLDRMYKEPSKFRAEIETVQKELKEGGVL